MNTEEPVCIESQGERLIGVLHRPQTPSGASRGMVIVVGGPQYRVGSHRQFVLLARALAARGTPVLRFDLAGMGDSDGEFAGFERSAADIRAAIDASRRGTQRARSVSMGTLRWRIRRADVCPAGSAGVASGTGESLGAHERGPGSGVSRRVLRPEAPQPRILERIGGSLGHLEGRRRFHLEPPPARQTPERRRTATGTTSISRADAGRRPHVQGPGAPAPERQGHGGHRIRMASRALRGVAGRSGPLRVVTRKLPEANHTFSRRVWRDWAAAATADFIA